ncbi:MAG: S41 family peptidase, partial [Hydrogenothermaceae bacterium]
MKSKVSMVIGVLLIFIAGMSFGLSSKAEKRDYSDEIQIIRTYTDVLKLVEDNYVENPDKKQLLYGSLRGMLSALDPYSTFFTPEEFKEFTSETQGEFGGLGIEITMENNKLLVV